MKLPLLLSLPVAVGCLLCLPGWSHAAAPKPNFIVINIDDLGYADIGPYGSKLNRTPHLDRMAKEGRKLTSFYAAPVCSPSRASLMTGSYPKRALPIPHVLFPGNDVGLHPDEVTVAELLQQAGYVTGIVGKWHLGDQPDFLPTRHGFDYYYGLPYSNDMGPVEDGVKSDLGKPLPQNKGKGQPPLPLMRNETVLQRVLPDDQQAIVELYTDEAVKFIRQHKDRSFFLYLPHSAVHFPIYPGKQWAGKSPHGHYSDWVEEVDWSVGRVLDAVRELKLAEKTLVIFTSDNGGTGRGSNEPLRGGKGSTWEGGMRVCTVAWWPGTIPAGSAHDGICGMFDILPTFVKLAGGQLPADPDSGFGAGRKLDGADITALLTGGSDTKSPHDTFYYYRGLRLEAVRHGDWKLRLAGTPAGRGKKAKTPDEPQLFNLAKDLGENTDVAAAHPDVVKRLQAVADRMKDDLGLDGIGPGCRALGKVANAEPLIGHDGKVRKGFAPK
jgi:arylsulfatase A